MLVGPALAKDDVEAELEALHGKWFAAYDRGDGTTMNGMETKNLVLVLPDGTIFKKTKPRAETLDATGVARRTLGKVSIRRFGDTAIMTGILTSSYAAGSRDEATTVVWVRQNGGWRVASAQWTPVPGSRP
jgi:ketosteroid isomerase-like protein